MSRLNYDRLILIFFSSIPSFVIILRLHHRRSVALYNYYVTIVGGGVGWNGGYQTITGNFPWLRLATRGRFREVKDAKEEEEEEEVQEEQEGGGEG